MLKAVKFFDMKSLTFFFLILSCGHVYAECSDEDAKSASDDVAQNYIDGQVFKKALILKRHLPTKQKEVASYIKANNLYYTVYSLVNSECVATITKRTNGKY